MIRCPVAAKKKTAPRSATKKAAKAAPKRAAKKTAKRAPAPAPARRDRQSARSDWETVSWWEDFYRVVRRIPEGRVTTYGAVAALGGHPRSARHVGYAMAALKDTRANQDVPWHRVLGAAPRDRAKVSIKDPIGGAMQRGLLEAEGVEFDDLGRVELARFGWNGLTHERR